VIADKMKTIRTPQAILLVGPTGVGKTPLGEYAERHGYKGRRCSHFDFGAALRAVDASGKPVGALSERDVAFIHRVLTDGALLENETFYIAEELLRAHISHAQLTSEDPILLNGLPRHVDQATAVDAIVRVEQVLHLRATPDVVYQRIGQNSGGDRSARADDAPEAISRKLAIFETRTRPLVEHYRSRGVPIAEVDINVQTTPEDIWTVFQ
jgi:adenylate kinase